jgi:hypothetical protein
MANNKSPNEKQPGEKAPGKYHYNPGNMSGKSAGVEKEEPKQNTNIDGIKSGEAPPDKRS